MGCARGVNMGMDGCAWGLNGGEDGSHELDRGLRWYARMGVCMGDGWGCGWSVNGGLNEGERGCVSGGQPDAADTALASQQRGTFSPRRAWEYSLVGVGQPAVSRLFGPTSFFFVGVGVLFWLNGSSLVCVGVFF